MQGWTVVRHVCLSAPVFAWKGGRLNGPHPKALTLILVRGKGQRLFPLTVFSSTSPQASAFWRRH